MPAPPRGPACVGGARPTGAIGRSPQGAWSAGGVGSKWPSGSCRRAFCPRDDTFPPPIPRHLFSISRTLVKRPPLRVTWLRPPSTHAARTLSLYYLAKLGVLHLDAFLFIFRALGRVSRSPVTLCFTWWLPLILGNLAQGQHLRAKRSASVRSSVGTHRAPFSRPSFASRLRTPPERATGSFLPRGTQL